MKFELFRDASQDWHWRLRGRDEQIIANSAKGYANKKHVYEIIDEILKLEEAELKDVTA